MNTARIVVYLMLLATCSRVAGAAEYPKSDLLIEAETLRNDLERLKTRPLQQARKITQGETDERGRGDYTLIDVRAGLADGRPTIEDAQTINARAWAAAFGDGTDSGAWSTRISEVLALKGEKSTVVVFDETLSPSAARVWWILKYWGVEDVRLLNGGVRAWLAAGEKLSLPSKALVKAAPGQPFAADATRFVSTTDVKRLLGARQMIDCRSSQEVAAGAIPGATHLDWRELVDPAIGKLRSADELRARFATVSIDLGQPVVTYCQTGGRASVTAFALELMGVEQVANYYGSWGAWKRAGK